VLAAALYTARANGTLVFGDEFHLALLKKLEDRTTAPLLLPNANRESEDQLDDEKLDRENLWQRDRW